MNNVLAIARKELRSYFASPIAYIVIGLFAVIFGIFFGVILLNFNQASQQGGGQAVNVNEQLIRPVFLNSVVVFLFMLPIVTMRSYAEEKRSGTIELLLTAPLTDLQIILGKFTGAMGLYASMLLVTALSMGAVLLRHSRSEAAAHHYLGSPRAAVSCRWACSSRASRAIRSSPAPSPSACS